MELVSDLIDMIYIFDEPTAGLHPKDRNKLIKILHKLKEANNRIILVEHDDLIMRESDYIIEIGPKAGKYGGNIIFKGNFKELKNKSSLTGKYVNQKLKIKKEVRIPQNYLTIKNASTHNLKNINVNIPLKIFCSITGVSGSGK